MSKLDLRSRRIVACVAAACAAVSGCVGSAWSVPTSHPGHPSASSGRLSPISVLGQESSGSVHATPQPASTRPDEHARHGHDGGSGEHAGHAGQAATHEAHDHDAAQQPSAPAGRYACPMHPEVVRDTPGQCPICGMNLVLRKGDK
jgi:hypothetical protein